MEQELRYTTLTLEKMNSGERAMFVCLIENISKEAPYEAIILAVKHKTFLESLTLDFLKKISTKPPILVYIKSVFSREEAIKIGFIY